MPTRQTSLLRTRGNLETGSQVCIVSFPASLGQTTWNSMVGGLLGMCGGVPRDPLPSDPDQAGIQKPPVNFACVWTGDDNSPTSKWFDPWVKNVDKARELGMTLIVYGHSNHPDEENQFTHGEQKFRLGKGQQAEVKYMNERGIPYKVFASDADGALGGILSGDLVSRASDGPILLSPFLRPRALLALLALLFFLLASVFWTKQL